MADVKAYLENLRINYFRMPRGVQEILAIRISQIITIGFSLWVFSLVECFFYNSFSSLPLTMRVLAPLSVLIGSFGLGTNTVAPVLQNLADKYRPPH